MKCVTAFVFVFLALCPLAHSAPVHYSISGSFEWEGQARFLTGFVQLDDMLYYGEQPVTEDILVNRGLALNWKIDNYNFYDGTAQYVGDHGSIGLFSAHRQNYNHFTSFDWFFSPITSSNPFYGFTWTPYDANKNQISWSINLPDIMELHALQTGSDGKRINLWLERTPPVVPEPSTMLLFAIGLIGIIGSRKLTKYKMITTNPQRT